VSYRLTIEPLGESIDVEDGQTMLDAALRAGVWLPYACNHGLCGTCKVTVQEGDIAHNHASSFALMDVERDEGRALACCATLASDVVIEAEVDEEPDARHLPVADGDGLEFQAGQYLNLHVPGLDTPRAFSIASPPSSANAIELHVRLVEGGAATTWLHRTLAVGDELRFTAPLGRFFVRRSRATPLLFLAGGSGLSSPLAMVLDLLEEDRAQPITLIHGARRRDELYRVDVLEALAARHANFRYVPALSDAGDDDWVGERGYVHEVAERLFDGRFAGLTAYLCGPPPMIDACLTSLMRGRLFEEHIFAEHFFTGADAETPRRSALFKKF
jgi:phenol hydroxylase P5 protein